MGERFDRWGHRFVWMEGGIRAVETAGVDRCYLVRLIHILLLEQHARPATLINFRRDSKIRDLNIPIHPLLVLHREKHCIRWQTQDACQAHRD